MEKMVMLTAEIILQKIERNMGKIRGYGVKNLGVFGSYVRNEQNTNSDIDFLVEFETGKKNFDNYMDLKLFLEELFEDKIDLVIKESNKTCSERIYTWKCSFCISILRHFLMTFLKQFAKLKSIQKI